MIFKVGQLVRVKHDANTIPGLTWDKDMDEYLGTVDRIADVITDKIYTLEKAYLPGINDDGYWRFIDSWLIPVEDCEAVTNDEPENPISDDELIDLLKGEI